MKRTVIKINEELCTGCGACVAGCHEGVLQVIDGKARVVRESHCDGMGACIGDCPVGALSLEEREVVVVAKTPCCSSSVIQAENALQEPRCCNNAAQVPMRQFPIQLRLVSPEAPFLRNQDLIVAADCTAFVCSDIHSRFMKNNSLVIACPKLDHSAELYVEKLTAMIDLATINSITVILMKVPCCSGLLQMALQAQTNAKRKVPVKKIVVGIRGDVLSEEWV